MPSCMLSVDNQAGVRRRALTVALSRVRLGDLLPERGHLMRRAIAACVLVTCLGLIAASAGAAANVLPPQANAGGGSLSDWAKRFFIFDAAIPVVNDSHPALDAGDVDCSIGQSGNVWFLETTPDVVGDFERRCSIPTGTKLYVPVFQWVCAEALDLIPVAECLPQADAFLQELDLSLTVDGETLDRAALDAYRAATGVFQLPLVEDSYWEWLTGVELADSIEFGSDAIGVLLHPLSVGTHEIVVTYASETFGFGGSLTYRITVTPGAK